MNAPQAQLSAEAIDILTELVNIGVGRAASSLSELIQERIELTVPTVRLEHVGVAESSPGNMDKDVPSTVVVQDFQGQFAGSSALIFPKNSGLLLAGLLSGVEDVGSELDVELSGLLLEVGNILLNAVMGTFSNEAQSPLDYTLPRLLNGKESLLRALQENSADDSQSLLVADVQFQVKEREISGSVVIVFTCGSVVKLLQQVEMTSAAA